MGVVLLAVVGLTVRLASGDGDGGGRAIGWITDAGEFAIGDTTSDVVETVSGLQVDCVQCPIAVAGGSAWVAGSGEVYRVDVGGLEYERVAEGERVFASDDGQFVYIRTGDSIERMRPSDDATAGPWIVPDGRDLTNPPQAAGDEILLTDAAEGTRLFTWAVTTGDVEEIPIAGRLIDTYQIGDEGISGVATFDCVDGQCQVLLWERGQGVRKIDAPAIVSAMYRGGGFSPNGNKLATFVGTDEPSVGAHAHLAVVSLESGDISIIQIASLPIGEPVAYGSWSDDGSKVLFGGLDGHSFLLDIRSDEVDELGAPASYSTVLFE